MALAEARAAWQRTANRCLVQEDAKRAPRLACCSSLPPTAKHEETGPTSATSMQDIPSSNYLPFNGSPSYPNLSPNSRWWLQLQPNYGYQMDLMDVQKFTSREGKVETFAIHKRLGDVTRNEDDSQRVHETSHVESSFDNQYQNFMTSVKNHITDANLKSVCYRNSQDAVEIGFEEDVKELRDEDLVSFEVSKNSDDVYFDSESSWVGVEKNTPWWRTADTDELALVVAQRSLDLLDNCDLPMPQNSHIKKKLRNSRRSLNQDEVSASMPVRKSGFGNHHVFYTNSAPASLTAGSSGQKLRLLAEDQFLSPNKPPSRDSPTCRRKPKMHEFNEDTSKARLLEALRHSQTRAREAEKVAKQACAEKEHVIKLIFRQASELFAYKQWLQLLQLENTYFQIRNKKNPSPSSFFPEILPCRAPRMRKTWKSCPKSSSRKWAKRARPRYDVGRYAIIFAVGLGLVGAGLLLGWTIGWMLPTW